MTTCTHKQLYGPRGGLILLGDSADTVLPSGRTLRQTLQSGLFPLIQGAPVVNSIAAKAYALGAATTRPSPRRSTGCVPSRPPSPSSSWAVASGSSPAAPTTTSSWPTS
ncbi:hypothetical protein ACFQ51_21195 [Streptomyces kaempferi]